MSRSHSDEPYEQNANRSSCSRIRDIGASDNVPGARSMALSPKDTLFVGTREAGKVYALPANGNPRRVLTTTGGSTEPTRIATV